MVRSYQRKTTRSEIPENDIQRALLDINNGNGSIRTVAERYGMKKSMLHKRIMKLKQSNVVPIIDIPVNSYQFSSKYSVRQVFSKEEETRLADYLVHSSKLQYGLTYYQVRQFAYSYAMKLERRVPESWIQNKIAGIDWMKAYMKRHSFLALRKPESTSMARNTAFNQNTVNSFFDNLEEVMNKYNFTSDKIVNVDESGVNTVVQMPKIISQAGCKQVGQAVSGERGEQVTFVGIIVANGNAIPPAYIFPRVRFKETFMLGAPEGSIGISSPSGWMTREGFVEVAKQIKKFTNACPENPVLVLMDNHDTHSSLELIMYCRENGLVLLTFPPHTTHRLQPLDVCVFGPLKARYKANLNMWLSDHPGKNITIYDIAHLTAPAFDEAFSRKNIISAFRKTGCYPYNRQVFSDDDFVGALVTDFPVPSPKIPEIATPPSECANASTSTTAPNNVTLPAITPEDIRPYPKLTERLPVRGGRKKKKSAILTSTPEVMRIAEESREKERKKAIAEERNNKSLIGKKSVVRKIQEDDTSESEFESLESNSSTMDADEDLNSSSDTDSSFPTLVEGDYVLVKFAGKKVVKYFVGRIERKICDSEFEISFLKFVQGKKFIHPDREDTSEVDSEDIVRKLPQPSCSKGTARSESFLYFSVNFENYLMG